jgi:error-prone DNA polymerase
MGFYPPASLIRDGQRRGVEVLPPDVTRSAALCRLEDGAVRIGLGYVNGLGTEGAATVVVERDRNGDFTDGRDLATRLGLKTDALERLVASGACDPLGPRRQLLWELGLAARPLSVRGGHRQLALDLGLGTAPALPEPGPWELLVADYAHTGLSLREHPIAHVRRDLIDVVSSADLKTLPNGARITIPGLAIARQRPASANGVVFLLLEDEHGLTNLILMPDVYQRFRLLARTEPLLLATGTLERRDRNINVQVELLEPLETPGRRTIGGRERSRGRPAAAAVQDLRAVAPPPMHFAQGRRRA